MKEFVMSPIDDLILGLPSTGRTCERSVKYVAQN